MDFYGFSLWHDLLSGSRDWFASLDLGHPDDFDPEDGGFDELFSRLGRVIDEAGMRGKMGGCFHVSSGFIDMLERFDMIELFTQARERFSKQVSFQLGMHCTFGNDDLPLDPRYTSVLARDVALAGLAGATCIVAHPPRGLHDQTRELVALLASPAITSILDDSDVALHWENLGPDCFFGSPNALVAFQNALRGALDRVGFEEQADRHLFCLDTGHLLLYRTGGPGTLASRDEEIKDTLPVLAKDLATFHLHANDGTLDHHVVPGSEAFMNHPSRQGIDRPAFLQNSRRVMEWLRTCEEGKGKHDRHVHVEALRPPFSLDQLATFGKAWLDEVRGHA